MGKHHRRNQPEALRKRRCQKKGQAGEDLRTKENQAECGKIQTEA